MASDVVETLFQEAIAHLEAIFAEGKKYARYPFAEGTPAPVVQAVFGKVRERFPHLIARLDRCPAGSNAAARIHLTQRPGQAGYGKPRPPYQRH
jgi:hypothetical protein